MRLNLQGAMAQRYLFAFAAGILLALAFPNFNVAGFGWVAPGLLMIAGLGLKPGAAFRVGFAGGVGFFLLALNWLLHIPMNFMPFVGWLGLSLYLSVFTGIWVWLGISLFPVRADANEPLPGFFLHAVAKLAASSPALARIRWTLLCGLTWVGLEMTIARFLSGFPWLPLGMSQYKLLPVLQIAPWTGVYGVSFLMVWFAVCLVTAGLLMIQKPVPRTFWLREVGLAGSVLAIVVILGYLEIRKPQPRRETITAALIQPSIPQTLIWDERENTNRFKQLIKLSEEALQHGPDMVVWPEASVPTMVRYDEDVYTNVVRLCTNYNVWMVLGSDDAEPRTDTPELRDYSYYNSSFAFSPGGKLAGTYRKRRLVIFGEYIPFVRYLPFLKVLSPAGENGFTPGNAPNPFELRNLGVKTSVLICFEDVFPHIAREYVQEDTDFLLNITNNGWFGESAAQWQHAANAVFRAVENRIPLVRCANNGLTCWVDEFGGMHDEYFEGSSDVYKAGFKLVKVPVLGPNETRPLTFYTRHGDIFGWSCVGVLVLGAIFAWRNRNHCHGNCLELNHEPEPVRTEPSSPS